MFPAKGPLDATTKRTQRRMALIAATTITIAIFGALVVPLVISAHSPIFAPTGQTKATISPAQSGTAAYYGANGAKNFAQLFQTIKSMTIQFNFTSDADGTSAATTSELISYSSQSAVTSNGNVAYLVNLTGTTITGSENDTESALVWVDASSGSILQVTMDGEQWTGAAAQRESNVLTFITANYLLSLLNSTTVQPVSGSSKIVTVDSCQLSETSYSAVGTVGQYKDLQITVGTVVENGMQIVLSSNYIVPGSGAGTFRVLSVALN